MYKKLLALLLAVVLAVGLLPGAAFAADSDFVIDEDGVLWRYNGPGGDVVIPDGVTSIGVEAFKFCRSLTSVTIPDGVTEIGMYAFRSCTSLTNVTIPASVTKIGQSAFENTPWLESLGEFAIVNGILLDYQGDGGNVVIPDGVTCIGENAFYDFSLVLTGVTIPDSVTCILDSAFLSSSHLTSVVIPDSVTTIGERAFFGCASLADVTIPDSITDFGAQPFNQTPWQRSLGDFPVVNGILLAYQGYDEDVVIPDHVTAIGGRAFSTIRSMTSVVIPDGVTSIGYNAFNSCSNLTSITIPASVTFIGRDAFSGSGLTDVYYGGSESQWEQIDGMAEAYIPRDAVIHFTDPEPTEPTGTSGTTFSPDEPCTRAQIVTFLWRAYGEKEPTSTTNPFTDVNPGDYFYKAVLWAVEQGITTGKTGTTFAPESPCTRKEAVTFQYQTADKPPVTGGNSFTDVPTGNYYADAVAWAVEQGVTKGISKTVFAPDEPCTLGQIVTFLYRELGK